MPDGPVSYYCVIQGHGEQWEGFCPNLDLAVEGRSLEAVRVSLMEMVSTYVEDALKEAEPDRSRLLNRRAPFWVRLKWAWRLFRAPLGSSSSQDATAGFPVLCHG
jgi:hypothetical protein